MAPRAFMLLLLLSTATATTTRFQLYGDAQGCDTADTPDASMPIDTRYRTARCTLIPGRMRTVWSRAGTEIPEGWRVGCKKTSETATRYLCCSESDGEECNMRLDGYYNPGECHEVQDGECTFYGGAWYKVEEETTDPAMFIAIAIVVVIVLVIIVGVVYKLKWYKDCMPGNGPGFAVPSQAG